MDQREDLLAYLVALSLRSRVSGARSTPLTEYGAAYSWYGSSRRRGDLYMSGPPLLARRFHTSPRLMAARARGARRPSVAMMGICAGATSVSIFLVLSGYLITVAPLGGVVRHRSIALGTFWVRAPRRLFPALLAARPGGGALRCDPRQAGRARPHSLGRPGDVGLRRQLAFYLCRPSYWALFSAPSPLEHTWSLAIEERILCRMAAPRCSSFYGRSRGSARVLLAVSVVFAVLSGVTMSILYLLRTHRAHTSDRHARRRDSRRSRSRVRNFDLGNPPKRACYSRARRPGIVSIAALGVAWRSSMARQPPLLRRVWRPRCSPRAYRVRPR